MSKLKLLATFAEFALAPVNLVWAEDPPVETQVVDALNKAFGSHAGFRANHAKGIVVEGSFTPAPRAAELSRSPTPGSREKRTAAYFLSAAGASY